MKKLLSACIALLLCAALCAGALALTEDEAKEIASGVVNTVTDPALVTSPFIGVVNRVQNSVVGVNNYQTYTYASYNPYYGFGGFGGFGGFDRFGGGDSKTREELAATGSGVVVYGELILTNYHVVENASRVTVSALNSEEELAGTVLAYDEGADVAVVYVPGLSAQPAPLGDSDQLQVGEWAICIGNPLAEEFKGTVTVGIVSALDRQITSTKSTDRYGRRQTVTNSMIQTDAAINSGNSGGGLFNVLGQLMGVPSQKYSGSYYSGSAVEGIGLAIPINTAKPFIEEALVRLAKGDVPAGAQSIAAAQTEEKPLLGVVIRPLTQQNDARVYAGAIPAGVLITELSAGGPADAAGLRAQDIIVEIDGQIAQTTTVIRQALDSRAYGDTVQIKVYRVEGLADAQSAEDLGEGEYLNFSVKLFKVES